MSLVSIIIPAYNREPLLKRAIETALQQTARDIEVIVVDDGSTDKTAMVAQLCANVDPRVQLIRHKTNRGAQAARNTGVQVARGRWLAFCDSDDAMLAKSLELRLKVAETEKVDVVHSDCYVLRKGSSKQVFGVPKLRGSVYRDLLAHPGPMFQGMLISAYSFAAIGRLDERVVAYQEWDTAIRLAKIFSFGFVAEPTFIYDCTGNDNISKKPRSATRGYEYIVQKHFIEMLSRLGPRGISHHYRMIANLYSEAGDFRTAAKFNRKSFIWWPSPQRISRKLRSSLVKVPN